MGSQAVGNKCGEAAERGFIPREGGATSKHTTQKDIKVVKSAFYSAAVALKKKKNILQDVLSEPK